MLSVADLTSNTWVLAVLVVAMLVRSIVKARIEARMFAKAIEGAKPGERPRIILAMRGLIGRGGRPEPADDKE